MHKPKLVRIGWTDFNSTYLLWILREYFDIEDYNPDTTYTQDCVFCVSRNEYWHDKIMLDYLEKGFRE